MELELELELEELMYKMLMCMGRGLTGMEEGEEELMDRGMERMDMELELDKRSQCRNLGKKVGTMERKEQDVNNKVNNLVEPHMKYVRETHNEWNLEAHMLAVEVKVA